MKYSLAFVINIKYFYPSSELPSNSNPWQPDHLLDDAGSTIKKLGVERANGGSYSFNSLLSGNAQLVLGSDWPVSIFLVICSLLQNFMLLV